MRSLLVAKVGVFDVLVVGVAVAAELEVALRSLEPGWLLLPAVWLYTLPLLARGRWPLGAPLFVIGVQVVVSFGDVPGGNRENWGVVAYVLAFWVFGSDNPIREAVFGLGVGLLGIVAVTLEDPRVVARESFSVAVFASLTWLAAVVLRQRNLRLARAESRSAALEQDHRQAQAAVPDNPASPTYTGHIQFWFGDENNLRNGVEHDTGNFRDTGTDGSVIAGHTNATATMNANGVITVSFDHLSLTCPGGLTFAQRHVRPARRRALAHAEERSSGPGPRPSFTGKPTLVHQQPA